MLWGPIGTTHMSKMCLTWPVKHHRPAQTRLSRTTRTTVLLAWRSSILVHSTCWDKWLCSHPIWTLVCNPESIPSVLCGWNILFEFKRSLKCAMFACFVSFWFLFSLKLAVLFCCFYCFVLLRWVELLLFPLRSTEPSLFLIGYTELSLLFFRSTESC